MMENIVTFTVVSALFGGDDAVPVREEPGR